MSHWFFRFSILLTLAIASPARADDQSKAQELLVKATAMASDPTGKRAVSQACSEILSAPRMDLVRWRRDLNLSYGDLFLAYHLSKIGVKLEDLATQLKSGQTVWQIAKQKDVKWSEIVAEAKRMNSRIDANLVRHFENREAGSGRDQAEGYDPYVDSVKADGSVSQKQIQEAQDRYLFLRGHTRTSSATKLDTSTEGSAKMVRTDPVRTGGPSNPDVNTTPNRR